MTTLAHPLAGAAVTTRYGAPNAVNGAPHTGADFAYTGGSCGRIVRAAADGVAQQRENVGGGHGIEIDHGGGIVTGYWHLASRLVRSGQAVRAGQAIATVGASGTMVTGCHLHFELKVGGATRDPLPALGGQAVTAGPPRLALGEAIREAPPGTYPDVIGSGGGRCDVAAGWRDASAIETAIRPELEGYCTRITPGGAAAGIVGGVASAAAPVAVNIGIVILALVIGWAGVRQVLGMGGGVTILARR